MRSNVGFFREAPREAALQGEPCFGAVSQASWFSHTAKATVFVTGGTDLALPAPRSDPSHAVLGFQKTAGTRERQEVSRLEQVGVNP